MTYYGHSKKNYKAGVMGKSLNFGLFLMLCSSLFLFSCLKEKLDDPKIIIDPPEYNHWVGWKETENRIASGDWQSIDRGDTLKLGFNYLDVSQTNFGGTYYYNFTNLNIDLDKEGDVKVRGDSIVFIPLTTLADSISLPIHLIESENDTLLVIRNIHTTPIIEVKYKKVEFY